MFIWFAVASVVLVAVVFKSPGVDYRTVALGALLPLGEAAFGGPRLLHSVVGAALVLVVVVLATQRRRLLRRRLLGVPIGIFAHLVLDGSFTDTTAFWWPVSSRSFAEGQVPELDHLAISLVLEVVGALVAVWAWGWLGLADPAARKRFLADGRLDVPE